ncbi:MAG: hypothetical protein PVH89_00725 [Gammaproteobacteria bacterium]
MFHEITATRSMFSTRSRLCYLGAFLAALITLDASAQVRTYDNPEHEGFAVSYCGADSSSCGEYMATAWCVAIGYEYATDWAARAGASDALRTVRLDDGAVCEGAACESFARITCGPEAQRFTTPVLGPSGKLTVLSADRRSIEQSVDSSQYRVMVPGCSQREPGVFVCASIDEYEHCRTLMFSRMIHSCRADRAFADVAAEPRAAAAGEYEISVESDAVIRIRPGVRGSGQVKGDARIQIQFELPAGAERAVCRERRSYVYFPTGPDGGQGDVGKADDCDVPVEVSVEAHGDDVLRAYDLCETFAAWGLEIEDSMEVLVAGLFRLGLDGRSSVEDVIAPYSLVEAPLTIECGS